MRLVFSSAGAVLAAAVMAFPLMVRAVRLSLDAVDQGLELAARTLGATRLDAFVTVTLPLMLPGILAGLLMAFAASLGEFGATITFASNVEGPDAHAAAGHLHRDAGARWRCRRAAPRHDRHRLVARRPRPVGGDGALGPPDDLRHMIDIASPGGSPAFTLDVDFHGAVDRRHRACSAPAARARPRSCRRSPAVSSPTPAASRSTTACSSTARSASTCRSTSAAIGYVFQDARLFPHLSVRGNLHYG